MINEMNIEEVGAVNGGCLFPLPPVVFVIVAKYVLEKVKESSEEIVG